MSKQESQQLKQLRELFLEAQRARTLAEIVRCNAEIAYKQAELAALQADKYLQLYRQHFHYPVNASIDLDTGLPIKEPEKKDGPLPK